MEKKAKQKAVEMVEKYVNQPINFLYIDTQDGNCIGSGYMTFNSAKQCALIAVDEIIDAIDFDWMEVQNLDRQHAYWQKVKQEIEKL